ncbi:lactoylglutathione lyase [Peribacillus deserti]|uniref:Lactoylglutathione lyase n=1 Tax=Peribacillus deserti TaxID=673318 RepID=A0ABS2QL43_9BACI|nr:VOC family protein [Peribacillus deserti]MBM7693892.1 lactoylglutathione lyase [Peribacillus deserti]
MSINKLDHIGIMVRDMDKSITFYQDVIGLTLKDRLLHTNGVIELAFLGFNNEGETEIELIKGYNDSLPNEGIVHHFAVKSEVIEEEFRRIKGLDNVEVIDDEIITLPNGYRYFFIYGPDREWIEFFQR